MLDKHGLDEVYVQAPHRTASRHLLRLLDHRLWSNQPSDFGQINPADGRAEAGWIDSAPEHPVVLGYPAVLVPYTADDDQAWYDLAVQQLREIRPPHVYPHDDERTASYMDVWVTTELGWLHEDLERARAPFVSLVFPWHLYREPFSEKRIWGPASDPARLQPPSDTIKLLSGQAAASDKQASA